jgi:esterase FrsA
MTRINIGRSLIVTGFAIGLTSLAAMAVVLWIFFGKSQYRTVHGWWICFILFGVGCTVEPTPDTYRRVKEDWKNKWIWSGADTARIETALANMKASTAPRRNPDQYDTVVRYGSGHWVFEFEALGNAYMTKAMAFEEAGEVEAARNAFLLASSYYQIGKFPYTRDGDWEYYRIAYEKSMAAYERAGRYFSAPLEVVELPYKGGLIRGYLHLPSVTHRAPVPVLIASGGIDVFKVENYPLVKLMNTRGIAVVVLDIPGVGESNYIPADPNHNQVFSAMLTHLEKDRRIDGSRAAVFATSFGGNAAAKVAFTDERFVAVVAACAPVHEIFDQPVWATGIAPAPLLRAIMDSIVPEIRLNVLADRFGLAVPLEESDYAEFAERSAGFSLVNQGLIPGSEKAKVPLLVINTVDDDIAPLSDMELLADAAEKSELMYMGEGGHCGEKGLMISMMSPWLESYLLQADE